MGTAQSIQAARRYIARHLLSAESKALIERCGFTLNVWARTDLQLELNGGPRGYVWSVGK